MMRFMVHGRLATGKEERREEREVPYHSQMVRDDGQARMEGR